MKTDYTLDGLLVKGMETELSAIRNALQTTDMPTEQREFLKTKKKNISRYIKLMGQGESLPIFLQKTILMKMMKMNQMIIEDPESPENIILFAYKLKSDLTLFLESLNEKEGT